MTSRTPLDELAASLNALERVDSSEFQRRARVLQSLWREEHGWPCGEQRGPSGARPLGSRLPMPWARETLANFITDRVRHVVESEVCDPARSAGKLFAKPRIFNDLLSSQPLCFNLFGELTADLDLASKAVRRLTDGRFAEVTSIDFEHSPGRADARYLNDRSAFDVFLRCRTSAGGSGFVGIEVKYHESLKRDKAGSHKPEYDAVADQMGCFNADREALMRRPLQQIWRDHLLAGATRLVDGFDDAVFVVLYPRDNPHVAAALDRYRLQLTSEDSFSAWTMEDVVGVLREFTDAPWVEALHDRYLDFSKVDTALGMGSA